MDAERFKVPIELLSKRCDPESFDFETTSEVPPLEGMIGQQRAFSAMELALNIREPGFNLFISGPPGTGRNTALKVCVERAAIQKTVPPDWGYVHNFQDPSQPIPLSLPCGQMRILAADMNELIDTVSRDVPQVFESDEYTERMEVAMKSLEVRRQEKTAAMEKAAAEAGFALRQTHAGISSVPLKNGQLLSTEDFAAMPQEEQASIRQRASDLQHLINRTLADIRRLGKTAVEDAREVDREIVSFTLSPIIDELQEKYADFPEVVAYFDRVEADMVEHLDKFKPRDAVANPFVLPTPDEDSFLRYRVNDLIDNTECDFAPIVFEHNPTYYNLFGRIDYQARMGMLNTNHTMIKGGAIHEANGGYLILQAHELLANPMSWQTLKRTLQSREIRIENMGEHFIPIPSSTLRPKPIPVDAKVIIIGTPDILHLLRSFDQDFARYFKVNAEFDT